MLHLYSSGYGYMNITHTYYQKTRMKCKKTLKKSIEVMALIFETAQVILQILTV